MSELDDQLDSLDPSGRSSRRKRRRHNSTSVSAPLPVPAQYVPPLPAEVSPEKSPVQAAQVLAPAAEGSAEASVPAVVDPKAKLVFPPLAPLDKDVTVRPLPATIAVVAQQGLFDERLGKRRRKKNLGSASGKKECPFCHQRKAVHIQPKNIVARLFSMLGIRTFSCRSCHLQHMGFGSSEAVNFTWRQLGVFFAVLAAMLAVLVALYPMLTHVPTPDQ